MRANHFGCRTRRPAKTEKADREHRHKPAIMILRIDGPIHPEGFEHKTPAKSSGEENENQRRTCSALQLEVTTLARTDDEIRRLHQRRNDYEIFQPAWSCAKTICHTSSLAFQYRGI